MENLIEKYFDRDYPENSEEQYVGSVFDIYKKAFETARLVGFNQGYICAVATIINTHGEDTIAEDVLGCCLPDDDELLDIDEVDLKVIEPIIAEINRKRNLNKTKP